VRDFELAIVKNQDGKPRLYRDSFATAFEKKEDGRRGVGIDFPTDVNTVDNFWDLEKGRFWHTSEYGARMNSGSFIVKA